MKTQRLYMAFLRICLHSSWAWAGLGSPCKGELRSVLCMILRRPNRGAAAVGRSFSPGSGRGAGGECHCASLVHTFKCTGSANFCFTKRSHVDQPKIREQVSVLFAWRWRKRKRIY